MSTPVKLRPITKHEGNALLRVVRRLPATYTRPHGTRYLLAAHDVQTQALWDSIYKRQTWNEVLDFLKAVRRCYPDDRCLHIVLDNRGSHKKPEVVDWCRSMTPSSRCLKSG